MTIEKPVERELKGDEAHSYTLALKAGQFLNVVVKQKGVDVVVALFDAENKKLAACKARTENRSCLIGQNRLLIHTTGHRLF
ncbi:MAG: hypothetical protein H0W58_15740 [Acidobacteria bacterium]|nr:hypothetical protein [Acidobacteriota bacterium]